MIKKLLGLAMLGCMEGLFTVVRAGDSCGGCLSDEKKDSKESPSEKQQGLRKTKTRPCLCGPGFSGKGLAGSKPTRLN